MKTNVIAAAMALGIVLGSTTGCMGTWKSESMDRAPLAVKNAVATAVGNHKVKKFEKEQDDGKTVYEASFDVDGVEHTITLDETGSVIEEESEVDVADLPPAVAAAVLKAQPLAQVKEAVRVKKGEKSYFEIDAKVGGDKHEILIGTDGTLLSDKVEAEEDEDKQGEKHEKHDGMSKKGEDKD